MDIEPPSKPIESWKDFFIHLGIITLGLLIALSLEGLVAHIHERNLVREADANIKAEIRDNQKELEDVIQVTIKHEVETKNHISFLEQIKKGRPLEEDHGGFNFYSADLNRSSWETAASTGAFSFMPYREVKSYEDIYATQKDFALIEQNASDAFAAYLAAYTHWNDLHNEATGNQKKGDKLTAVEVAQIDALEEKIYFYLVRLHTIKQAGDNLDKQYVNFLKSD
jgi:hypothetical protein